MQTFLQLVAHDLYSKIGNDLSRTVLVFPNKRANLFFNGYLAGESDQPIWAPAAMSISDLFQKLSVQKTGDPIRLVCELYKVFKEETQSQETLDDFYFWGELLISDFDDVDKNMVDADKLFSNLQGLKNLMDNYDFLDKEQEEAIRQFFQNFSIERRTELKEKFISLWDKLGSIYHRYQENLTELGIAYEGMLYRNVIEQLDTERLKYDKYIFVGFNVLNKVEHQFFKLLQDADKAMFYWDYDIFYTQQIKKHEAGEFLKRNLQDFPNELPDSYFDSFKTPKNIRYISASTENAQARFLPEWIRTTFSNSECEEKENAVVLCNEALLLPVLHSIPQEVKNVNITMGFPLAQTPVYSFINAAMELQTNGYRSDTGRFTYEAVSAILKHPYTQQLSTHADSLENELTKTNRFYPLPSELKQDDFLANLFTPRSGIKDLCDYLVGLIKDISILYRKEGEYNDIFNQLYRESLFQSHLKINRLYSLIESGELNVRTDTLKRLISKVLTASNIPFHGEPAIGMQVMGVLETRNLDFRNLVMLSLNEGQLPKSGGESSFIPYNLRKAFGMTTIEHKNAVYAYYFYRLIQRAENITLLYNTSSDGLNRGEESRFMLQLLVEGPHEITREYLEAGQSPQSNQEIQIEKTPEVLRRIYCAYDSTNPKSVILSPSALNAYLDCRLRFYYRYVAGLKTPDEVSAEIDSALFGTIFHLSAQLVYTELTANGNMIQKEDLERLLRDEVKLQSYVDRAFKKELFKVAPEEKPEYNGVQLINSKVILSYLKQLLRNDLQYTPFEMVAMEKKVSEEMTIQTGQGPFTLRLGGTIDRMDAKEGTLRIVDYKTGGSPKTPANIEQLFTPSETRPNYIFQTFLYAAIMSRKQSLMVAPALLYIHRAASESYSPVIEMGEPRKPKIPVNNFAFFEDEFRERLQALLEEVFDEKEAFTQTKDIKKCSYCDFKAICKR
ncbi:PD-(D/E)XK nuclease family protein [Bacteroides caecimuris]|jgi:CRISPR/Cas system-associated exonuclease Cas4 (RecB family)|uniref:Recombinase RecB n=3 Tax=Bacteroides caecimuris TaxID=1796613 RepID=A0A1C7GY58_9BACE|nr:PD-(D/E)XK nuclease family protein [Bacteroides caecimuris]ANU57538.1 recombinase RecB [Bacteroides caecimuris]OXE61316.1 PD-(D/E)XK nuclease family protein [Bacteroides caecimuris]QQR17584.1 PD-(D/E)XK nuclease family protein [Bacteroides caecimuris]UQA30575.1 PD-(D/E)XK nuclease family protein [Bacteroides caecimuris]